MTNVMITDPDVFAREGIKQMLAEFSDIHVVCEADTASETFRLLDAHRPDVCIVEIAVDQHYGLGFLRQTICHARGVPVLVMSDRHEHSFALRAMRAGAAGYLDKACTAQQLAHAVRTSATRRPYLSDTMCELLAESILGQDEQLAHAQLSDDDFEILVLMAHSAPPAQIANTCNISVPKARLHRKKIMKKMNLETDASVVAYALQHRLIERSYLA